MLVIQTVRAVRCRRLRLLFNADLPKPNNQSTPAASQILANTALSATLAKRDRTVSKWTGNRKPICTKRHHGFRHLL